MSSYKELLQQRQALEQQIADAKEREFAQVVDELKQKMVDYGITLADLGLATSRGKGKKSVKAAEAKYRDPESGVTWSGRGKPPRWIAGKERDTFKI
ncbi:H-NS family nucleoid-associated regulatory protein [Pararobbsia alpina]|uniref:DNA-binding protein Bv3F n=1 Tax=Pararobbsia alpina TaxID=621374 RepID=A0A6S7CCY3_9BURK|nr:H-NS histone family protein [Pararobbsia alpina]CAB3806415.1 DNA-binding protein Bv3F [Pararobbsia alpina]